MEVIEKSIDDNVLKLVVDSNEESLFSLLKVYCEKDPEVELVGLHKGHYLIDETEFFLKTKSKNPLEVFKKNLDLAKKDLEKKKVK
jgi:DNA-directed RNA polymerase subunit L